jgi:hypothetical protein
MLLRENGPSATDRGLKMSARIRIADLAELGRANPDSVGAFRVGTSSGRSTFFYGTSNQTLYIDDRPKGTHNIVLNEHPEIIEEIVPTEVFRRYRGGEFFDPRRGGQAWEVVASYALLGRLGGVGTPANHYNVVSVWSRSRAGVPGKLVPMPDRIVQALPGLLRALKGEGLIRSYGEKPSIDDNWIVVVEGELEPVAVGEYLTSDES